MSTVEVTSPRRNLLELITCGALFIAIVVQRFLAIPKTIWEFDETLFMRGVEHYNPFRHNPPPPGYPVFMGFAKVVDAILDNPFLTLVTISVVSSILGAIAVAAVVKEVTGSRIAGWIASAVFYGSPGMLVHSTLPQSDPGGIALLATATLLLLRLNRRGDEAGLPVLRTVVPAAIVAALTVGWRPQYSIAILPLLAVAWLQVPGWKRKTALALVFGVVCVGWLIPLMLGSGGIDKFIGLQTKQADYFASHDAALSRTGWTPQLIAFRFIAHPYGHKYTAFPILAVAALGGLVAFGFFRRLLPVLVMEAVYLGFALWSMDPADGVRYAIPSVLFFAWMAGFAALPLVREREGRVPRFGTALVLVLTGVWMAGAYRYVSPVLSERRTSASPPVQAAEYARKTFPAGSVALYELPLWPHATYLLADYSPASVDKGMKAIAMKPEVPAFLYVDGRAYAPDAREFRWRPSDAYAKLTRNHYRVSTIVPLPPRKRFAIESGVFMPERTKLGAEWRWLAESGVFELPDLGPSKLRMRLQNPGGAPYADNRIAFTAGEYTELVHIKRGEAKIVEFSLPPGARRITFRAQKSYVPRETSAATPDPRRLSVMMLSIEQVLEQPAIPVPSEAAQPRAASQR